MSHERVTLSKRKSPSAWTTQYGPNYKKHYFGWGSTTFFGENLEHTVSILISRFFVSGPVYWSRPEKKALAQHVHSPHCHSPKLIHDPKFQHSGATQKTTPGYISRMPATTYHPAVCVSRSFHSPLLQTASARSNCRKTGTSSGGKSPNSWISVAVLTPDGA